MKLRSIGLLAVLALVFVGCGGVSPQAAGPGEGIQVHGDWTIDVYNQDGSLDSHLEFKNAFVGESFLAQLLAGEHTIGQDWRIAFGQTGPDGVICPTTGRVGSCTVYPIDAELINGNESIRLTGSATVETDGQIERVMTEVGPCDRTIAPADCFRTPFVPFTLKILDPSDVVAVTAGQIVQIQVDISFTTG